MLLVDNDPLEQMKSRLKEMDALQLERDRLAADLDQINAKCQSIEDRAAKQVRSVLDTNAKLQQELVQLSRDLSDAEHTLSTEKKRAREEVLRFKTQHDSMQLRLGEAESQIETHGHLVEELQEKIVSESKAKESVVQQLKVLAAKYETIVADNESLTKSKDDISSHVWNLTDKLKAMSSCRLPRSRFKWPVPRARSRLLF